MPVVPSKENCGSNIDYYNEIASDYDAVLDMESSNEIIRKKVEHKFTSVVKEGLVLDFGGGTGRDLHWLVNGHYKVIFCEPSEEMRKKAIANYKSDAVTFLENDSTDFTDWAHKKSIFPVKLDAILSDFAVINCIKDIDLLFKKFAHITSPGSQLIVLMLKHGYKKSLPWKFREFIRSVASSAPLIINIHHKEYLQTVYVYSQARIKKASITHFDLISKEDIFEFTLFHFVRK